MRRISEVLTGLGVAGHCFPRCRHAVCRLVGSGDAVQAKLIEVARNRVDQLDECADSICGKRISHEDSGEKPCGSGCLQAVHSSVGYGLVAWVYHLRVFGIVGVMSCATDATDTS